MSNNVKILYNNQEVFNNIAPTPFVSFSQEFIDFGNTWNQVTNINLEGQLTGIYLGSQSFTLLNTAHKTLLNRFKNNFGSFKIIENNEVLYEAENVIIQSINVDESNWYGLLPFNIELRVYEENLFPNHYGIVEPEEVFSFSDKEGQILEFVHSISAKGIKTLNKNAIQNAKEWVLARSEQKDKIIPFLVKNSNNDFILQSKNETIDRFNGTYSQEYTYKKSTDRDNPKNCFLNYTIDINFNIEDDFINAKIDGNFEGNEIAILRTAYNNLNLFNICNKYVNETYEKNLSSRPITNFLSEDPDSQSLSFSVEFNNDFSPDIVNDYSVDISQDFLSCITTVNFSTNIFCRYGDKKTRWDKVKNFYETSFNPFQIASQEYTKEITSVNNLKQNAVTESITFNEFDATISYSAEYTNKVNFFSEDLLSLDSSVSVTPSIIQYVANTSAFTPREHNVQDLEVASRSILELNVTATAKLNKNISVAESQANTEIARLKGNYLGAKPILEDKNVNKNEDMKTVSITERWSYEGTILK